MNLHVHIYKLHVAIITKILLAPGFFLQQRNQHRIIRVLHQSLHHTLTVPFGPVHRQQQLLTHRILSVLFLVLFFDIFQRAEGILKLGFIQTSSAGQGYSSQGVLQLLRRREVAICGGGVEINIVEGVVVIVFFVLAVVVVLVLVIIGTR